MSTLPAPSADSPLDDSLRCPTCRAVQAWSDVCRRCKCDLRLLRETADACRASRRLCLLAVHQGRTADAVEWARECVELDPGEDARRLLAVCLLLHGDWEEARALTA